MICRHHIVPERRGFYKNRSSPINLSVNESYLLPNVKSRLQVDVVYTDLLNAFDSVFYPRLIQKLKLMGICGRYLRLIVSYISVQEHTSTVFLVEFLVRFKFIRAFRMIRTWALLFSLYLWPEK